MFTRIYKLKDDNKWHMIDWTANKHIPTLFCGIELAKDSILEDRMIGKGHIECKEDPDKKDVCPKCFNFLTILGW